MMGVRGGVTFMGEVRGGVTVGGGVTFRGEVRGGVTVSASWVR